MGSISGRTSPLMKSDAEHKVNIQDLAVSFSPDRNSGGGVGGYFREINKLTNKQSKLHGQPDYPFHDEPPLMGNIWITRLLIGSNRS